MSDLEIYTFKGVVVARIIVWYFLGCIVVPFLGAYLTKKTYEFFFERGVKKNRKPEPPSS